MNDGVHRPAIRRRDEGALQHRHDRGRQHVDELVFEEVAVNPKLTQADFSR